MAYALPSNTSKVSCSWQCHKDRNPPSVEAGTDYATAYGSPLYAVEDGVVTAVRRNTSTATGRFIEYVLKDGRTTRSLHLSEVWVRVGDKVKRGQQIGKTGASGHGSEWGYGSHVHQTLWKGTAWAEPTIDFAKYVGEPAGGGDKPFPPTPTPTPPDNEDEDENMKGATYKRASDGKNVFLLFNEESGFWVEHSGVSGEYNNSIARNWGTGSWPTITEGHAKVIKTALNDVKANKVSGTLTVDVQD